MSTEDTPFFDFSLVPPDGLGMTYDALVGGGSNHVKFANVDPSAWTPIGVDIAFADGGVAIRGSVQKQLLGVSVVANTAAQNVGDLKLLFGASYVRGDWVVRLDDIVCNWD